MQWEKFSYHVAKLDSAIRKLPAPRHLCVETGSFVPWLIDRCMHPACRAIFCSRATPDFWAPSQPDDEE